MASGEINCSNFAPSKKSATAIKIAVAANAASIRARQSSGMKKTATATQPPVNVSAVRMVAIPETPVIPRA